MRTREPILTRGRDHWDRVNLPPAEFQDRLENVRERMAAAGIDALLVYGTGDRDGNIAYLSNLVHKVPGFPLALVVTLETAVVLNQRSSRTRPIVERNTWIDDVRFTRALWSTVEEVLAELTDPDAQVALVGSEAMSKPAHDALTASGVSPSIVVRDRFLDDVRSTKSARESDQIRRAGRLVRTVADDLPDVARNATHERRLEAELDRMARLEGAQDVRILCSNPTQTEDHLRPAERRTALGPGLVSVYLAARFEGYWAALARSFRVGGDDADTDDLVASYEAARASIEPGDTIGTVVQALETDGVDVARGYPLLSSIGLELEESPVVDTDTDPPAGRLEPGMAIELLLPIRPEGGHLQVIGDTLLVTDDDVVTVTR